MQLTFWRKFSRAFFLLITTLVMAACGGGGSTKADPPKATISGAVTFPVTGNVIAKRVASNLPDTSVTVEVFGLDGTKVASVNPNADGNLALDQRVYAYSVSGLPVGVDYVIKVKRGKQVLKKLVEKKDVVEGAGVPHNVDAVSTAAVVIASQKLSTATARIVLGDTLPAGKTVANLSTDIATMKPALIENNISAAVNGGRTNLTSDTVNYANTFNMVVVAVSNSNVGSIDSVLDGTSRINDVPFFDIANPTVAPVFTNMSSTNAGSVVSQIVTGYTPPKTDAGTADMYVQQAKGYLARQDIANASNRFELALAADDTNAEANLGGAITSGLMLLDDPDFKAILARWDIVYPSVTQVVQGTSPIKLPFGNISSVTFNLAGVRVGSSSPAIAKIVTDSTVAPAAGSGVLSAFKELQSRLPQRKTGFKSLAKELGLFPANPPTIGEMQILIDKVIIPRIDKILARLAKIEGKTNNTFIVTKAMQGNPVYGKDVTLGDGEYYTLDAALNIFQVLFKISTSYNFDVPSGYTYDTISQDPLAMINDPSVFTLKTGGTSKMTAALDYAKLAADRAQLAFNILKARNAGVGAFDLTNMALADKTNFQKSLDEVIKGLAGATTIDVKGKLVAVNFTKFFTNPLDRSKLPTFGYDVTRNAALSASYGRPVAAVGTSTYYAGGPSYTWATECSIYPTSDLPDYSLNGILPGNTSANNVAGFNGILPMLSGKLLSNPIIGVSDFTTDGTFIYTHDSSSILKIDPATGVISTLATGATAAGSINRLLSYQGSFYSASAVSQYNQANGSYSYIGTISPVTITGGTYTVGNPVWTSPPSSQNSSISAFAVSGTDIYYAVSTWNQLTNSSSTDVRKLSNLTSDTSIFTVSDWVNSLAVSDSYLYIDGSKYNRVAPYALVASYANLNNDVLVGGYFYRINNGKIVKYAGTPSGGTAKYLSGLY